MFDCVDTERGGSVGVVRSVLLCLCACVFVCVCLICSSGSSELRRQVSVCFSVAIATEGKVPDSVCCLRGESEYMKEGETQGTQEGKKGDTQTWGMSY